MADFKRDPYGTLTLEEYRAIEPTLKRPLTLGGVQPRTAGGAMSPVFTIPDPDPFLAALNAEDEELFVIHPHHEEDLAS